MWRGVGVRFLAHGSWAERMLIPYLTSAYGFPGFLDIF